MSKRIVGLPAFSLVVTLLFLPLAPALAGDPEKREATPVMPEAKPAKATQAEGPREKLEGLVGTVVAADSGTGTIVVDVPLEKNVLRVGAWTTADTTFSGVKSLGDVKPGSRVRIDIRRIENGNEVIGLDVLGAPKG